MRASLSCGQRYVQGQYGACAAVAGDVGGIFMCAGTWVAQQPVGIYWSSLCWQGGNKDTGGTTHAMERLHTYCALWNSAGTHSGDGHVDVVVQPAGISAELSVQGGSQGLHAQVRESLPLSRAALAHRRGGGMALWNNCVPAVCVDVFSVSFRRQSPACVTGSVSDLLETVNSQSYTCVAACFTVAG